MVHFAFIQHSHSTKCLPVSHATLRNLFRSIESGSSGGDDFGMVTYTPFLLIVLFVGLVFGMLGFWRVGASYATQNGTQLGAVAPGQGNATIGGFYLAWSNAQTTPASSFNVVTADRRTVGAINMDKNFDLSTLGQWTLGVGAQTQTRSERFYPGAPKCSGGGCNE